MATDLESRSASTRYDAFVGKQVNEVQARLRRIDVVRSFLCLGVVVLAYGLVMALFDLFVDPAGGFVSLVHVVSFVVFLAAAGYFLVQGVVRLYRRINPYYAARQLEEAIPDAKNSVINWLDLKEEELPTAIRGALGQKAAKDLKKTDGDKAVNPRSNWLLFSILAALVLGLLVLLAVRPNQFSALLQRAYAPFQDIGIGTRAKIEMIQPREGNLTTVPDKSVEIRAHITGYYPRTNQPAAPRLLFRYSPDDAFVPVPLADEGNDTWSILRKPDQVRTGFFYKVAAGDAETPEYQVTARGVPRAERFEVTYKYRLYLRLPDLIVAFPNEKLTEPRIQAKRGALVAMKVQTNRKLKEGSLALETAGEKLTLPGKLSPDGRSFTAEWTLEASGTMRVLFTSTEDEPNSTASLYTVIVEDDQAPQVVLTEPGKDISLPLNGTLNVAGLVSDDVGVRSMTLKVRMVEGAKSDLAGKPFRAGKDFKFDDGGYPDKVDYRDFMPMTALTTPDGKAFATKAGMVLEYWLEARDNSDYPHKEGNVGISKSYRVKLEAPADEKKEKDRRDSAAREQEKFEKGQDDKHARKNEERKGPPEKGASKGDGRAEEEKLAQEAKKLIEEAEKKRRESNPGEGKGEEKPASESKGGESGKEGAKPKSKDGKGAESSASKEGKDKEGAEAKGGGEKKEDKAGESRGGEGEGSRAEAKGGADKKEAGADKSASKSGDAKKGESGAASAREGGEKSGEEKGTARSGDDKTDAKSGKGETKAGGEKSGASAKSEPKEGDSGGPDAAAKEGPPAGGKSLAKEKGGESKIDPSTAKAGEHAKGETSAKADGEKGPRGAAKASDKLDDAGAPPSAHAKGDKDSAEKFAKSPGKRGSPRGDTDPATARDDGIRDAAGEKLRDAKAADVLKRAEDLADPEKSEAAAHDLSEISREAKDEGARDIAREMLKKDGREVDSPGKVKKAPPREDTDVTGVSKENKGDPTKKGPPESAESKGDEGKEEKSLGKGSGDEGKRKDAKLTKGEGKAGDYGPGAAGMSDKDLKAIKAAEDFLKRPGDLQLDDLAEYLKKHATPEALERAGWSKADLDRWLKAAAEHDDRLARERAIAARRDRDRAKTPDGSGLSSIGPRKLDASPTAGRDPLDARRPLPPPEFRDAHRTFSGGADKK